MIPSTPKRLLSLEYFRGICAIAVSISHFLMQANYGDIFQQVAAFAVEAFFPLSGFVLGSQIVDLLNKPNNLRIFLIRRWMRTLPPYVIALTIMGVLLDQFFTQSFFGYLLFFNYLALGNESGVNDFYPIAWSLSVEEWFYILFPVFLVTACRHRKTSTNLILWTLVFAIFFAFTRVIFFESIDPDQMRTNTLLRLDSIAIGFLFFVVFKEKPQLGRLFFMLLLSLSLLLLVFFDLDSTYEGHLKVQLLLFASPIFFGTVVTLLATLEKRLKTVQRGLISVAGVWLGRTSYSMYLFHLLIIYLFFPDPSVNDLPLFLGILLLFCTVFYWVLENPILELRPKYKRE